MTGSVARVTGNSDIAPIIFSTLGEVAAESNSGLISEEI